MTLCPWCGEDVREPAAQSAAQPVVPEVRTHGPLTVIEGRRPSLPRSADPSERTAARGAGGPPAVDSAGSPGGPRTQRRSASQATESQRRARRPDPVTRPPAVAASATGEPVAADLAHRLETRAGGSAHALATAAAPEPVVGPAAETRTVMLGSAIYVTGTRGLQAGSRYGIGVVGAALHIMGPVDIDPMAVAIVHPLRGIDATGLQGRLIVTAENGRRERLALVFMSVAGGSAEGVADAIVAAAANLEADSP